MLSSSEKLHQETCPEQDPPLEALGPILQPVLMQIPARSEYSPRLSTSEYSSELAIKTLEPQGNQARERGSQVQPFASSGLKDTSSAQALCELHQVI